MLDVSEVEFLEPGIAIGYRFAELLGRRADDPFFVVIEPFGGVWILALDGKAFARIELPQDSIRAVGPLGQAICIYVGSRSQRSIERVDLGTQRYLGRALALYGIAFPRGFAPLSDGGFIVASGTNPMSGEGRRALFCYDANGKLNPNVFVDDPLLDPLDLALHNGCVYVTSEFPGSCSNHICAWSQKRARTCGPSFVTNGSRSATL